MSDIGGKSRGFGFVSYEEPEAAEKVCNGQKYCSVDDSMQEQLFV